jgi:hypothetical protein
VKSSFPARRLHSTWIVAGSRDVAAEVFNKRDRGASWQNIEMRKLFIILAAMLSLSLIRISVTAATQQFTVHQPSELTEITGRISDIHGYAVAGLKISLRNWFGSELASAVSDINGVFHLRQVPPGRYYCNFRPLAESSRGETVILYVPTHSLKMNLTVNRNPPALARAMRYVAPPIA